MQEPRRARNGRGVEEMAPALEPFGAIQALQPFGRARQDRIGRSPGEGVEDAPVSRPVVGPDVALQEAPQEALQDSAGPDRLQDVSPIPRLGTQTAP